jgi:glutaredoxin
VGRIASNGRKKGEMMFSIYTRDGCSFCEKAKKLLNQNNLQYTEYSIGKNILREEVLEKFPGVKMLPIVVGVDGTLLGGYEDLVVHLQQ